MNQDPVLLKLQPCVRKLMLYHLALIFGFALLMTILKGQAHGYSTFLGGLAWGLPSLFYTWRVFNPKKIRTPNRIVLDFMVAEALKLLLSAIFLVLILELIHPLVLWTLFGFIVSLFTFWLFSVLILHRFNQATVTSAN